MFPTIALLFIASMVAIGAGFSIFLVETRLGSRSVRVRTSILDHEAEPRGKGPPA